MTPERWKQIEQFYHAALKLEPGQRAAFLQEACAGDEDLRREVESLLKFEKEGEGFIEQPAMEAAAVGDPERASHTQAMCIVQARRFIKAKRVVIVDRRIEAECLVKQRSNQTTQRIRGDNRPVHCQLPKSGIVLRKFTCRAL